MMSQIYNDDYTPIWEDPFATTDHAVQYALRELPSEDKMYLIGTDDGIEVIVFQGMAYWEKPTSAKLAMEAK